MQTTPQTMMASQKSVRKKYTSIEKFLSNYKFENNGM